MPVLVLQRKSLVLALVEQKQNFACRSIIIVITAICSLTEKKSINVRPIIKMLTFCLNFV